MSRAKHIFIFICIFSVFSVTLQASIISSCKVSKAFKTQFQQNPVTEEEEETHGDESPDKEVFYMGSHSFPQASRHLLKLTWAILKVNCPSHTITILVPPPKF